MRNVAINGLGRIGRLVLRHYSENPPENIRLTAANSSTSIEDLAYLIKYDSVHGKAPFPVSYGSDYLTLESRRLDIVNSRDPALIPWKEHDIDIVLECTGVFKKRVDVARHLQAGASKVIISAPAAESDATFVIGCKREDLRSQKAPHCLKCVVHDQQHCSRRQSAQRCFRRYRVPDDDNGPCLYVEPGPRRQIGK